MNLDNYIKEIKDELIDKQAEKLEKWGLQWNDDDWIDFLTSKIKEAWDRK